MKHLISLKTNQGTATIEEYKKGNVNRDDVVGVILQTEVIGEIIPLDQWNEIWCSEENCKVFNKTCSEAEALQTLSGLELTRNIVNQNEEDGEEMTAAMRCWQYKKGSIQWYLPSLYELGTIVAYRDELNKVLKMLGATLLRKSYCAWSSSESDRCNTWVASSCAGYFYCKDKFDNIITRAVAAFSPLQHETSFSADTKMSL